MTKSRNFSFAKVWCWMNTRGGYLAAHSSIHASFILRRGLTRFLMLLRPENNRGQEFFWYSGMRPGCQRTEKLYTHCSQSFVSPDWIPPGTICFSTLALFTWINPLKTSFLLSRVFDSRPSVLLHPSGGHNCLTRCRLQLFLKPQVWVEYGKRTRGHQSRNWLWTSVLNFSDLTRTGVTHSPPHPTGHYKHLN